jgi:protoheme IX farnesyltransferase
MQTMEHDVGPEGTAGVRTVVGSEVVALPGPDPQPSLRVYLAFVKPHIDATFVLVAVTGGLMAWAGSGPFPLELLLLSAAAVALLSAGAECWTNLLDRDVDAIMPRTSTRALATGTITVHRAMLLGVALTGLGLVLAAATGPVTLLCLVFALVDNVVVYSALAKRSTPWSVVLGSAVGPLVLWAGYAAVREPISPAAWLLGALVAAWVPVHIWAIAIRYRSDYAKARIPVAPLVWTRAHLGAAIFAASVAMGVLAVAGLDELAGAGAAWVLGPVALVSALVGAVAVLLPWHERLAPVLIRSVTAYLVLVLVAAIALAV